MQNYYGVSSGSLVKNDSLINQNGRFGDARVEQRGSNNTSTVNQGGRTGRQGRRVPGHAPVAR